MRHATGSRNLSLKVRRAAKSVGFPNILPQNGECSNERLLQGAAHAVLRTLYFRAHRIVLNGISCLLRGLGEGPSLNLFLMVIVGLLA
jgi:hypothetical protein